MGCKGYPFTVLKILFIYFYREGKKKERNTNLWLPLECPLLGIWPVTQACALTGNQTYDPLVRMLALSPLSHTSQGKDCHFKFCIIELDNGLACTDPRIWWFVSISKFFYSTFIGNLCPT